MIEIELPVAALIGVHRTGLDLGPRELDMIHVLRVVRLKHQHRVTWSHHVHDCGENGADGAIGDENLAIRAQIITLVAIGEQG